MKKKINTKWENFEKVIKHSVDTNTELFVNEKNIELIKDEDDVIIERDNNVVFNDIFEFLDYKENNISFLKDVFFGTLLGQSTTIVVKKNRVLSLRCEAHLQYAEYIQHLRFVWSAEYESFSISKLKYVKNLIYFTVRTDPYFNDFFTLFYLDNYFCVTLSNKGRARLLKKSKIIGPIKRNLINSYNNEFTSKDIVKCLSDRIFNELRFTPCILAYWYMDAGYFNWARYKYCIDTGIWDLASMRKIKKILRFDLKIKSTFDLGWCMLVIESTELFEDYVRPYIIPLFSSKFRNLSYKYYAWEPYFYIICFLFYYENIYSVAVKPDYVTLMDYGCCIYALCLYYYYYNIMFVY